MGLFKKVVEETIWMRKSNAILPSTDSKSNSFADLLTARNYEHVLQMLQNKNSQSKNHINLTLAVEKLLETKQEILAHQTDSLRDKIHTTLQHQNIMTSHIFTEETETAPYLEDANPCQEKFEFGRKKKRVFEQRRFKARSSKLRLVWTSKNSGYVCRRRQIIRRSLQRLWPF